MKEIIVSAIRAAIGAGKEILEVYNNAFDVELKEDRSPLTEADKRAHLFIQGILESTALPILSEEGRTIPFSERNEWSRFWLVDPLDGTKEFIRRNGEFTVNIALIENGIPIAGVIYVPVTDQLYYGGVETGSYLLEEVTGKISMLDKITSEYFFTRPSERLPRTRATRPFTIVGSRSHSTPETESFINTIRAEHGELAFLSKGSSIKICLVAEGLADIYPRLAPTMEWDTAAGHAIARGAGCKVVTWPEGKELIYNKENLLNPFFVVSAS